ncbi:hypothetical protein [Agromyces bauzanensis]
MTATTPDATPPKFTPATAPTTPAAPTASTSASVEPPAETTPWYRRAWVLAVGAVLIAVLSFGSGFVTGNVTSAFRGLFGGPGTGIVEHGPDFPGGPQFGDGDGDGDGPGDGVRPGSTSSQ